jgi:Tol biopolymer transport system component
MSVRFVGGASVSALLALLAVLAPSAAATPPGRNGLIAWQQESRTTPPHLWVANPDGSAARQVFANAPSEGEFEVALSPTDPNLVFFSAFFGDPFSEDIYSGNLATGAVKRVTTSDSADIAPTVSPDGTKIAYFGVRRPRKINREAPPPPERIRVANVDGSGDRALTPRKQRSIDPDWSPDGTRIVYTQARLVGRRQQRVQNRLVVMNADGSGRRPITAFGARNEINAKWMPDGQTILFEQLRRRDADILAMSPNGGAARPILATDAWETNPVPSPDGTRFVFTSDRDRPGPDRLGPGFEVYTSALDGSGILRLTNNRNPDMWPDWQRLP